MPVPPLPEGISARLREAIDPRTGRCKHHPNVQLCELIQNGSRWAVRRKICYKCGSRNGSSGGKHHRPGIAVKHPDAELQAERRGQRRASSAEPAGGRRRSGSGSALAGSSSRDLTRSRGHSASRRNMSNMSSACLERSNHRMMRSMHNIGGGGTGGNINRSGSGGGDDGPLPRRTASQSMHDITAGTDFSRPSATDAGAPSRHHSSTSSFHGRALEFTSKAMAESGGAIVVHPSPLAEPAVHEAALAEETAAEFDESDPVIMVPLIVGDGGAEMPPPPPRTAEELERHKERLELRRAHIRREREERRKRRTSATNKVTTSTLSSGSYTTSVPMHPSAATLPRPTREARRADRAVVGRGWPPWCPAARRARAGAVPTGSR